MADAYGNVPIRNRCGRLPDRTGEQTTDCCADNGNPFLFADIWLLRDRTEGRVRRKTLAGYFAPGTEMKKCRSLWLRKDPLRCCRDGQGKMILERQYFIFPLLMYSMNGI
ncbi:MAG: hypothetical protein K6C09_02970 [Oscillospiraceae bacterium]|nr:hypothetical protein [Oscillospiraceae bacterium]